MSYFFIKNINQINRFLKTKTIEHSFKNSIYKFVGIISSFVSVRILMDALGANYYSLWLALSSVIVWLNIAELGFFIDLQNIITKYFVEKDYISAQKYFSTYLWCLFINVIIIGMFCFFLIYQFQMSKMFSSDIDEPLLKKIIFFLVCSNLCLLYIRQSYAILFAYRKTSILTLVDTLSILIPIVSIYLVSFFLNITKIQLLKFVVFIYSAIPVFLWFIISFFLFYRIRNMIPRVKSIDFKLIPEIYIKNSKLIIFIIFSHILNVSDFFLINKYMKSLNTIEYNVVLKIFSVFSIIISILQAPIYSFISKNYHENNIDKLSKLYKYFPYFILFLMFIGLILVFFSNLFISIWLSNKIHISYSLAFLCLLYNLIFICYVFNNLLLFASNKINKISITTFLIILSYLILIAFFIYLNMFNLNILLSIKIISLLVYFIIAYFENIKELKRLKFVKNYDNN